MKFPIIFCFVLAFALAAPAPLFSNTIRPGQPVSFPQQMPKTRDATPDPDKGLPKQRDKNQSQENGSNQTQQSQGNAASKEPDVESPADTARKTQDKGSFPDPAEKDSDNKKALSIMRVGAKRDDASGIPLSIPENTNDVSFMHGVWSFERMLLGTDGVPLRANFLFNNGEEGKFILFGNNSTRYEAKVEANVDDGVLRMSTSQFISTDSSHIYDPQFIECHNGPDGAECAGTDGFRSWKGERIFPVQSQSSSQMDSQASSSSQPARAPLQNSFPNSSSRSFPTSEQKYAELSADGPELSPIIMEKSEKAKMDKNGQGLASLQGDWRFSRDLARKSDGKGIGLEFHFGEDGQGYSIIKDGSEKDFRANAQSMLMPDGSIRVKTDAYENGTEHAYYPTFMECFGEHSQELQCNVSNGWMRVENGRLVSLDSYEKNSSGMDMAELLPTTPDPTQQQADQGSLADLFASVTPQDFSAPQGTPLELPQKGDSVSFIQGSWICKTDLVRSSDKEPVIVQFTFDQNGKGVGIIREQSGKIFRSSAQASYRRKILRIKTSQYDNPNERSSYNRSTIECRDNGGTAQCIGKNGGTTWQATFLRQE